MTTKLKEITISGKIREYIPLYPLKCEPQKQTIIRCQLDYNQTHTKNVSRNPKGHGLYGNPLGYNVC